MTSSFSEKKDRDSANLGNEQPYHSMGEYVELGGPN